MEPSPPLRHAGRILALAVGCLLLWMLLQVAINALHMVAARIRGEEFAVLLIKSFLSPAIAAYFSFDILERRLPTRGDVLSVGVAFLVLLIGFEGMLLLADAEFDRRVIQSGGEARPEFWQIVFASISSAFGCLLFVRRKLRPDRVIAHS